LRFGSTAGRGFMYTAGWKPVCVRRVVEALCVASLRQWRGSWVVQLLLTYLDYISEDVTPVAVILRLLCDRSSDRREVELRIKTVAGQKV
jgi:hypothetical protein